MGFIRSGRSDNYWATQYSKSRKCLAQAISQKKKGFILVFCQIFGAFPGFFLPAAESPNHGLHVASLDKKYLKYIGNCVSQDNNQYLGLLGWEIYGKILNRGDYIFIHEHCLISFLEIIKQIR
jgi:hypothetical protein